MEPTHEPAIDVLSLALEDPTNMQGASSNMEDVNLSHDDLVDLNTQTEVNVKDVEGSIGASPNKILGNKSIIIPGIFTQNGGVSLFDLTIDPNSVQREFGLAFIESSSSNSTFDENAVNKISAHEDI